MSRKQKDHPLDSLTFSAPKLDEMLLVPEPDQSVSGPASKHKEVETRSSNVTLPAPIWEWIDAKHAEARSAGGKAIRKSSIIRAVFEVVMSIDVDLSGSQSEEEITKRLLRALGQ